MSGREQGEGGEKGRRVSGRRRWQGEERRRRESGWKRYLVFMSGYVVLTVTRA